MIAIDNTIISNEILKEQFVCDLQKCKGECCVAGDSGAPLDKGELRVLEEIFDDVKPFLSERGVQALEKQGLYVLDEDGEYTTPLIEGAECAYLVYDGDIAACGIEKAHKAGATHFKKPISCHLYPIRVTEYDGFEAVNYHKWQVCSDACKLGKHLQVPVYKFLKEPIIRKYGKDYFHQLEEAAKLVK